MMKTDPIMSLFSDMIYQSPAKIDLTNTQPAQQVVYQGYKKKNWSAFNKIYREGYKYHQKRCFDVLTRPAKRDSSLQSSEGWQNWMIYADVDNMVCGGTGKGVLTCYSKHEPQLVTLLTTTLPLVLY